jgi:hypothetical protein
MLHLHTTYGFNFAGSFLDITKAVQVWSDGIQRKSYCPDLSKRQRQLRLRYTSMRKPTSSPPMLNTLLCRL